MSLSGGQKARQVTFDIFQHCQSAHTHHRVALARAVYARTKYVLLDDPLSAVVRETIILRNRDLNFDDLLG